MLVSRECRPLHGNVGRPVRNEGQVVVDDGETEPLVIRHVRPVRRLEHARNSISVGSVEYWLDETSPDSLALELRSDAENLEIPMGVTRVGPFRIRAVAGEPSERPRISGQDSHEVRSRSSFATCRPRKGARRKPDRDGLHRGTVDCRIHRSKPDCVSHRRPEERLQGSAAPVAVRKDGTERGVVTVTLHEGGSGRILLAALQRMMTSAGPAIPAILGHSTGNTDTEAEGTQ